MALDLCTPDDLLICDGSEEEYQRLMALLIKQGTMQELSPVKRPGWLDK